MFIGDRLRQLREAKGLSQGDLEDRSGLARSFTSRLENGHAVPTVDTLEKYARALEVPMYRFFCNGTEPPAKPILPAEHETNEPTELPRLVRLLARMSETDRSLLLAVAQRMAVKVSR